MEKEALRRLLENLVTVFPFDELTTDASSTVIKLVRDLKGELNLHADFCTSQTNLSSYL